MTSGISVNDECKAVFENFFNGKKEERYICFRIGDDFKSVIVDHDIEEKKEKNPNSCAADLDEEDTCLKVDHLCEKVKDDKKPRWVLFDYEFSKPDGCKTSKVVEIKYCPEGANIKDRMVFTSTEKALNTKIGFTGTTQQCDSPDEVKEIFQKLKEGKLK